MERYHLIIFAVLLTVFLAGIVDAADQPQLVWIIIDQLSLDEIDLTNLENINHLQQRGAFGLMNVRTADNIQPESTYLSVGSGKRCQGSKEVLGGTEKDSGVVNQQVETIKDINEDNPYQPVIGQLGKISRVNGKKIAVLGNTDNQFEEKRPVISLVMDENGYVPLGKVDKDILIRVDEPWGYAADWTEMKKKFLEFKEKADAVVVETGDITRISDFSHLLSQEQVTLFRQKALGRIDDFIGFLLDELELEKTQLALISPTSSLQAQSSGRKLSWVLFSGRSFSTGVLTSMSTRREGLITISDLLPAFLEGLGIDQTGLPGNPLNTIKTETGLKQLKRLNNKIALISIMRPPFVKGFIGLQLLTILSAIITTIWNKSILSGIIKRFFEYLLIVLLFIPLNFLIISLFIFKYWWFYIFLLAGLSSIELFILFKMKLDRLGRIVLISMFLVLIITFDLGNDYLLQADSLLGYSSIIGARYYGLGNEYMGLYIGGMLIGITGFIELIFRRRKDLNSSIYLLLSAAVLNIFFVGLPVLGANFGGMVTAITAWLTTCWFIYQGKLTLQAKIILFSTFILLVAGIIFLDYSQLMGSSTHIGRAIRQLLRGDFIGIKYIIQRKLAMNIKLLRWTIWTRVLLAFLFYLLILFRNPTGRLKEIIKKYPYFAGGLYGGLAGSVITMFVNDSGVIAAATILFFPILSLLYLIKEYSYN